MSQADFRYDGYELDRAGRRLVCRYALDGRRFVEEVHVPGVPAGAVWDSPAADAAARIVHLLAGVSYYKTTAPPVVDTGEIALTDGERSFLTRFFVQGLAEFGYRNHLDLSALTVDGPRLARRDPVPWTGMADRPLVPFGGGIDSIVTVESVRRRHRGLSLFVVSRPGTRFEAIERAAAVTGLPVVRAERTIDPALLRSAELGFLNGHVPVTGILSAVAVMVAVLGDHGAVVMSNERSASAPTVFEGARPVNHQWSKGLEFEETFRALLAATFEPPVEYFSFLRARSELWVAERFARLTGYHAVFRSCNRAFHLDPARRLDHWCGTCDKCCFIDLVLSPFLEPAQLTAIFGGREPLADESLAPRFRALIASGTDDKPFECVGDAEECRTAAVLGAERADRSGFPLLQTLAAQARELLGEPAAVAARRQLEDRRPDFTPVDFLDEPAGVGAGTPPEV